MASLINAAVSKLYPSSSGSNLVSYYARSSRNRNKDVPPSASLPARISRSSIDSIVCHSSKCSLCLNLLKAYPSMKLPCTHSFHKLCVEKIENHTDDLNYHAPTKKQQDQDTQNILKCPCPLCRRTYPTKSAEYFFIEGCRIFFILKSQVKYTATSSKEKSSECKTRKMNEEEMVKLWRSAAHMGYIQAQMNLAHIYNHGDCVPKDFKKAAYWYQKQSEIGNARAQFRLARLYANGQGGIKQDFANAAELYKLSAEQGYPKAQLCYGTMLLHGKGCEQNKTEAADWLRRSADQGNEEAEIILGGMLLHGDGIEQNYEEAFKLIKIEADKGNVESLFELGELYLHGQGCDHNEKEAAICFGKAANENHLESKFRLGQMFLNGIGVEQSNQYALSWFKEAADQNHCDAQCTLANMCLNHEVEVGEPTSKKKVLDPHGKHDYHEQIVSTAISLLTGEATAAAEEEENVEDDDEDNDSDDTIVSENNLLFAETLFRSAAINGSAEAQFKYGNILHQREGVQKALKWYAKAAEQNYIDAICLLANLFYYGEGVEQSYLEAARWYKVAADLNNPEAQRFLGYMLFHGLGVKHPLVEEAAAWYLKAAHSGDDKAQFYIGKMLIKGIGVQTDYKDGYHWLLKSANQGNVDAEYNLAKYLSSHSQGKLIGHLQGIENEKEALKWCKKAVNDGHEKAQVLLARLIGNDEN